MVALYEAVVRAREIIGQPLGAFDSFATFVQNKSNQIRTQFHCQAVEYTVFGEERPGAAQSPRPQSRSVLCCPGLLLPELDGGFA